MESAAIDTLNIHISIPRRTSACSRIAFMDGTKRRLNVLTLIGSFTPIKAFH